MYCTTYDLRVVSPRLGRVIWVVTDEKTAMLPALRGTDTAVSGSCSRQTQPSSLCQCRSVPSVWRPGATRRQPLLSSVSVSAIQQVMYCCGSTYTFPLSWCQ